MSNNISINKTTKPLVEKLIEKVSELNLSIETTEGGAKIIDAGNTFKNGWLCSLEIQRSNTP